MAGDLREFIKPSSDESYEISALWEALLTSRERLREVTSGSDFDRLASVGKIQLAWQGGELHDLPEPVKLALLAALRTLAQGDGVAVVPADNELTTGEAAELLGVSRNYVVRLIDLGALPCQQERSGSHRRLRVEDVLAFRRKRQSERRDAIRNHDEASERLGLP